PEVHDPTKLQMTSAGSAGHTRYSRNFKAGGPAGMEPRGGVTVRVLLCKVRRCGRHCEARIGSTRKARRKAACNTFPAHPLYMRTACLAAPEPRSRDQGSDFECWGADLLRSNGGYVLVLRLISDSGSAGLA